MNELPFTFGNHSVTQAGVYRDTLIAYTGCDSIRILTVNVLPEYHYYDTLVIAQSDLPYTWRNQSLTQPGDYQDGYTSTAYACDSTYHLHLIVASEFLIDQTVSVCTNDTASYPYVWSGQAYFNSGVYYQQYKTQPYGMDSILRLNLTVDSAYLIQQQTLICYGEEFTYNGELITRDTIINDTMYTSLGCDSIVQHIFTYKSLDRKSVV